MQKKGSQKRELGKRVFFHGQMCYDEKTGEIMR